MAQVSSSQNFSSGFEPSHFRAANFSSMLEQCSSLHWLVNTPTIVIIRGQAHDSERGENDFEGVGVI